jgi:serine/threonine protein kinase/Tfp pilus assembly protein PilF
MEGSRLRQYVIAHKLGEGGMGVVWKARDTTLDRDVALKILPAEGASSEVRRERFFREARAASALNHPNIITVYEINSEGDTDFIAMEYVEGETLSARLTRGAMPIGEALEVARQMADAVARAHKAGIVHRDLKPGNVMINHDGLVKVLDFGLAKVDVRSSDERTSEETRLALTRVGTAIGTFGYMSPEQAVGDPVDTRSDVFSFGVVLYLMLTREMPFEGDTNAGLLRALHFGEPKDLRVVRPDVPAWLVSLVTKALAKDPKDRFANMGEVAAALRQPLPPPLPPQLAAREVPVSAPPPLPIAAPSVTPPPPLPAVDVPVTPQRRGRRQRIREGRRPVRRRFGWLIALGIIAYGVVPWHRVFQRNESAPAVADSSPSGLTLQASDLLRRYDRRGNVDRAVTLLEKAIADDPKYATAYAQLAFAYLAKNTVSPDPQWIRLAGENATRAVELNPDLAAAHVAAGAALQDAGNNRDATTQFERALELDPLSARALDGMARAHAAANRDDDARRMFEQAVNADRNDWRSAADLGGFYFRRGRYAEAITAFETARDRSPDNAVVLLNLGAAYQMAERPDDAASTLQRALEINPTGAAYTNFANLRFLQGRYAEAADAFEKAVGLNANNYLVWANLGDAYRWAPGRRTKATEAYRHAIQLMDQQIAAKPADANLRTRRALYLAKIGESRDALEELTKIPRTQTLTPQMSIRVALVRELAGDRDGALDAIDRALKNGFPQRELKADTEFAELRGDARYHRLTTGLTK